MSDNKSVVLPTFSGEDEAFQVWWTKFRAFATAKGFVNALLGMLRCQLKVKISCVLQPVKIMSNEVSAPVDHLGAK